MSSTFKMLDDKTKLKLFNQGVVKSLDGTDAKAYLVINDEKVEKTT